MQDHDRDHELNLHYSDEEWGNFCLAAITGRIADILALVQPCRASEIYRQQIFEYVVAVIKDTLGNQFTLPFGSVPLLTYMPDGDIDVTCLLPPAQASTWITPLKNRLVEISEDPDAPFPITNITPVYAEVMLIKCRIGGVQIDICANQTAGIASAVLFERINRHFGHDDLFKRSIMLTKTWCVYEARILGSHHSLISTFSLQTMLLHVFCVYPDIRTPVAALALFTEYYSNFDWANNAVTIYGVMPLSSLPDTDTSPPPTASLPPAISGMAGDFAELVILRRETFIASGLPILPFQLRGMNVQDPLAPWNNIGRSVAISNLHRITRAFTVGAAAFRGLLHGAKDGRLTLPKAIAIVDVIFANTWTRSGRPRPDTVLLDDVSDDALESKESELRSNAVIIAAFMQYIKTGEQATG